MTVGVPGDGVRPRHMAVAALCRLPHEAPIRVAEAKDMVQGLLALLLRCHCSSPSADGFTPLRLRQHCLSPDILSALADGQSRFLSRGDCLLFSSCLLSPLVIKGEAWLQLQFVLLHSSQGEERGIFTTIINTTTFLTALTFTPSLGRVKP